jgi:hypothetical protein
MWYFLINSVRYLLICLRLAHAHMSMVGRSARSSSEMSFSSIFSSITGRLTFSLCADISSIRTSSAAISSGSSMATTHGRSLIASLNALCMRDGTLYPLITVVAYLVMGRIIPTTSMIWKSHCLDFLIGFCPVMTISGSHES